MRASHYFGATVNGALRALGVKLFLGFATPESGNLSCSGGYTIYNIAAPFSFAIVKRSFMTTFQKESGT